MSSSATSPKIRTFTASFNHLPPFFPLLPRKDGVSPPNKERENSKMTSLYANTSQSNLSLPSSSSAPISSSLPPPRNAPAGALPPGTLVTVGKHTVTIDRWLSEGTPFHRK